jgi:hypothetical protein
MEVINMSVDDLRQKISSLPDHGNDLTYSSEGTGSGEGGGKGKKAELHSVFT